MRWWKQWESWKKEEWLKTNTLDSTDYNTLSFYFRFYTRFKIESRFWDRKLNAELEKMSIENQDLFLDRLSIIDVAVAYISREMAKDRNG